VVTIPQLASCRKISQLSDLNLKSQVLVPQPGLTRGCRENYISRRRPATGPWAITEEDQMSRLLVKLQVALIIWLGTMCALAQAPNPYGPAVSVENAKKAASAALAEARKSDWKMAVAVVDTGGILVYYEKMDNTQVGSADIAIEKARTAVRFKRPSKAFQDLVAGGGAGLRVLGLPGAVPIEGGIPLMIDGQIVGAIGVSGDAADHDGLCAAAGAATLK
jgi:glc operon protein GlcG